MSFAIEPVVAPVLDIPAPVVTVPPPSGVAAGAASSFQDHLTRARSTSDSSTNGAGGGAAGDSANVRTDRDRNAEPSERAEADRRNEESDAPTGDATKPASTSTAESKPKRTDEQGKVAEKKKGTTKDEKQEHSDGAAATDAVVAAVVVQDLPAEDEVTLGEEVVATAVAEDVPAAAGEDGKKLGAGPAGIDPTKVIVGNGTPKADPDTVVKAAEDGEAIAQIVAQEPVELDTEGGKVPVVDVPRMSEMHAVQKTANQPQSPKITDEVVDQKKDAEPTDGKVAAEAAVGQGAEVAGVNVGEKDGGKRENSNQQDGAATFATQLQGAVEAANSAGATTAAPSSVESQTTAPAATTPAAPKADAVTTGSTSKPNNTQQAAAELVRNSSSKDVGTGRVGGDDGRQNGGLSAADRARLVQRVARAVRTATDRGGELQIRLSPPELGQLRLQIQMTDGVLSARIEAETPQAKQVITENLGMLRDRLAEQNVRVDRIEVEVMNSGNGGSPGFTDRRNDPSHAGSSPRGSSSNFRNSAREAAAAIEVRSAATNTGGDGRLNVVI